MTARTPATIPRVLVAADQITRPVAEAFRPAAYLPRVRRQNGVERGLLEAMIKELGAHTGSMVLCGWSDYAKHLVNIFGEAGDVLAIADDAPHRRGWTFRGVPVVSLQEGIAAHPEHFACSRVEDRVWFLAEITGHPEYDHQPVHCFPSPGTDEGRFYDPWKHSRFYRELEHGGGETDRPGSMLSPAKLQLLLETAKQTLHLPGDVLELGAWQGGSAWALGKLLLASSPTKRLVLLDFFEELPRANPEGIMCLDEVRHWFSFYPGTEIHSGNVDLRPEPILTHEWSFIHYDAGFSASRLARCFDQLQDGGIMVLDNYGHIAANPGQFDRWFEARGHVVSSPPDSEQGWVLKHGRG